MPYNTLIHIKPMTNEHILELVKEHFQEGGVRDDGSCSEYYGDPDAFVKFALAIHEDGYNKGYDECSIVKTYD